MLQHEFTTGCIVVQQESAVKKADKGRRRLTVLRDEQHRAFTDFESRHLGDIHGQLSNAPTQKFQRYCRIGPAFVRSLHAKCDEGHDRILPIALPPLGTLRCDATGENQIRAIHERFEVRRQHAGRARWERQQHQKCGGERHSSTMQRYLEMHGSKVAIPQDVATAFNCTRVNRSAPGAENGLRGSRAVTGPTPGSRLVYDQRTERTRPTRFSFTIQIE